MQIYSIKLKLSSKEEIKNNFYYSILGAVLNIFKNDIEIYNSILSISPLIKINLEKKEYLIKISILWKKNFDKIISEILSEKKQISLDNKIFEIEGINFDFKIFDLEKIVFNDFSFIELQFLSPSFVKEKINDKQINYYLPESSIFLSSIIRKFFKIYNIENNDFLLKIKEKFRENIIISKFDIHTKKIKLKDWIKAWVVGNIKYNLIWEFTKEEKEILYKAIRFINFASFGNWTKLGLGQIKARVY